MRVGSVVRTYLKHNQHTFKTSFYSQFFLLFCINIFIHRDTKYTFTIFHYPTKTFSLNILKRTHSGKELFNLLKINISNISREQAHRPSRFFLGIKEPLWYWQICNLQELFNIDWYVICKNYSIGVLSSLVSLSTLNAII